MPKFCMVALIFAAADYAALRGGRKRREMVLYTACMAAVLAGGFFYFRNQEGASFIEVLFNVFNIRE